MLTYTMTWCANMIINDKHTSRKSRFTLNDYIYRVQFRISNIYNKGIFE